MSKIKAKSVQIFYVKISDWVLFDPKFTKTYDSFFPIKRAFLHSKCMDSITDVELKLIIGLIGEAHNLRTSFIEVNEKLWTSQGKLLEKSLSRLQQYQILTYSLNKERKKEIKEIKEEIPDYQLKIEKDEQEIFAKHFQKFVTETIGSVDLGFVVGYWKKTHDAFLTTKAFDEFCSTIMNRKNFKAGDWKNQFSYFQVSIKEEIESRGAVKK